MKNKLPQLCFGSEASTALLTEFWGSDQIICGLLFNNRTRGRLLCCALAEQKLRKCETEISLVADALLL